MEETLAAAKATLAIAELTRMQAFIAAAVDEGAFANDRLPAVAAMRLSGLTLDVLASDNIGTILEHYKSVADTLTYIG